MKQIIGRISEQHHEIYKVIINEMTPGAGKEEIKWKEIEGRVSGKFIYNAVDNTAFPAVGDWVTLEMAEEESDRAVITHLEKRKSVLMRTEPGKTGKSQIIATNIDWVFICMAVNQDFNLRRLERYLAVAYGAQITPIILLTKIDLCQNVNQYKDMIWKDNPRVEIMECSIQQEQGLEAIKNKIKADETAVFIGSSGVGKSTLVNRLMEEDLLKTNEIRKDDGKGRHTTTHRQLLILPGGGTVVDTPGMRELALDDSDVSDTFEDIEELFTQCKFRNCSHDTEPGCAVKKAIENGSLPYKRYKNYTKLLKEEINRQNRKKKSAY